MSLEEEAIHDRSAAEQIADKITRAALAAFMAT